MTRSSPRRTASRYPLTSFKKVSTEDGEPSSDPHPEFLVNGIFQSEGRSLLGDEEDSSWELRDPVLNGVLSIMLNILKHVHLILNLINVLSPPTVTGALYIGHGLTSAIQSGENGKTHLICNHRCTSFYAKNIVTKASAMKKEPSKRATAKKPLSTLTEVSDDEMQKISEEKDDCDVEFGLKVVVNAKGVKKGDVLKPIKNGRVSPVKKVRKMRPHPLFNKKSGSILEKKGVEISPMGREELSGSSASASTSSNKGHRGGTYRQQSSFHCRRRWTKRVCLKEMREKHFLHDQFKMVEAVPHARVRFVLILGHIFLISFLTNALCIVILEADSCGLLTVSTRVGGVPEVLPGNMIVLAEPISSDMVKAIPKGYLHSFQDRPISYSLS
ncbi:hypothetical protein GIB67_038384, partial [Kingdonia uniflora]